MLTSLIIEDSRLARKELVGLLADFPDIDIIGEAADGDGALRLIQEKQPDLLFLDIDLPGKNGFELLGELSQLPLVIFTTAFDEYALRSFDYNAVDYLLKPIRKDRLARAIEKAKRSVHNADQVAKERLGLEHRIFVKDGERCWFVTLRDLRLLESVGNYCRLYFGEERPLILKSLNYLEDVLDPKVFFRINRAQIVNLKEVDQILPWHGGRLQLTLKSGEKLEVSRRQTAKLKDIYSL